MYRKVLIPLDGSNEAEGVFPLIREELAPDAEVILLRVILPGSSQTVGGYVVPASQVEEEARSEATFYLRNVAGRMEMGAATSRCEVVIADSVSQGIADFAEQQDVDLIAMYTHDRKGLAALVKKSVAKDVQRRVSIEVKVFKPQELTLVS